MDEPTSLLIQLRVAVLYLGEKHHANWWGSSFLNDTGRRYLAFPFPRTTLTDQTLYTCVNDFVVPKLRQVEDDLALARAGAIAEKPARDETERLDTFRQELVELRDELLRVAALPYKPNLNDGVLITACPLWKLFRLPKWQKDLKACWAQLAKGDYDWAHLAHSIWPRRVEAVCERDRSIAIAHNLEHLCKVAAPESTKKKGPKRNIK